MFRIGINFQSILAGTLSFRELINLLQIERTKPSILTKGCPDEPGEVDHQKISAENAQRLSRMSLDDIQRERDELLAKLDPTMIEFIRKRKTNSQPKAQPVKKIYQTESGNEVKLPVETKSNWLNMKEVEPDKLEWMQGSRFIISIVLILFKRF